MNRHADVQHFDLFIDGRHVKPSGGEYSLDVDPATEEPFAAVALGGKADVIRRQRRRLIPRIGGKTNAI